MYYKCSLRDVNTADKVYTPKLDHFAGRIISYDPVHHCGIIRENATLKEFPFNADLIAVNVNDRVLFTLENSYAENIVKIRT